MVAEGLPDGIGDPLELSAAQGGVGCRMTVKMILKLLPWHLIHVTPNPSELTAQAHLGTCANVAGQVVLRVALGSAAFIFFCADALRCSCTAPGFRLISDELAGH